MDSRQELIDSLSDDELLQVWRELGEEIRRRQPSPQPASTLPQAESVLRMLGTDALLNVTKHALDELPGVDLPALIQRVREKA